MQKYTSISLTLSLLALVVIWHIDREVIKSGEMKYEMTLPYMMGPNRNVLFQTHLLFVAIYGLIWSTFNVRWHSRTPMCHWLHDITLSSTDYLAFLYCTSFTTTAPCKQSRPKSMELQLLKKRYAGIQTVQRELCFLNWNKNIRKYNLLRYIFMLHHGNNVPVFFNLLAFEIFYIMILNFMWS